MSRSDFWSIAATLIVAGVANFIGGTKTAYLCIGVGVCIILYLLFTHKKSEPASTSASANSQSTANPQITANPLLTANPIVSQHTYVHLPGQDQRARQERMDVTHHTIKQSPRPIRNKNFS